MALLAKLECICVQNCHWLLDAHWIPDWAINSYYCCFPSCCLQLFYCFRTSSNFTKVNKLNTSNVPKFLQLIQPHRTGRIMSVTQKSSYGDYTHMLLSTDIQTNWGLGAMFRKHSAMAGNKSALWGSAHIFLYANCLSAMYWTEVSLIYFI